MQEQGIVGLSTSNQPLHRTKNVLLCRLQEGVCGVIGKNDHVLALIAIVLDKEGGDVLGVVDAAVQLGILAQVVDANQQCLAATRAV